MWPRKFTAAPNPDTPLYVIGDIHGRMDLFEQILDLIDRDASAQNISPTIITVGDYVDRGMESREVIDHVMVVCDDPSRNFVALTGNHEEMLLTFLTDPEKEKRWLRIGGYETLLSFGIPPVAETAPETEIQKTADELRKAVGPARISFLQNLPTSYQSGNIFICHAGADINTPVTEQNRQTLIWNRNYAGVRKDGIWVVHGHTIQSKATAQNGRVGLDTGAFSTDRLTAARITKSEITFIDTSANFAL